MSSIKKVRVGKKKRKNLTKHYSDAVLFAMEYLKKNDDDKNDDEKVSNHDDNNLMYWNEEEDSELLVHMNEENEICKDEVSEYVEFFFPFRIALSIAKLTSSARPTPTPTFCLLSPTITTARKVNFFPPFTTFVTRVT